MNAPGPQNSICDVAGMTVGHAEDANLTTGATVIVPDQPALAAVDHRGGGIGSRDTVLLGPGSTISNVHAICLSGGSAYGLDAAGGVMHALRQKGVGFLVGAEVVPIVPQAIIFDLACGGPKSWDRPPWWDLGLRAFKAAEGTVLEGNTGAGLGATAGPLKGGTGTASAQWGDFTIGAIAIANPMGSVVMPGSRTFWAWDLEQAGELGGQKPPTSAAPTQIQSPTTPLANTTLAVVATDATLDRDQARRLAIMAQDGLARAIRPAHGPLDGDTVFMLSTGRKPLGKGLGALTTLGALAADVVARAVMRGVYCASPLAGIPAYRDLTEDGVIP